MLDVDGDRQPRPWLRTRFNEQHPQFSPDGRWVAYTSDEAGSNDVYVRGASASDGAAVRVSTSGGFLPRWRADGRELFFLKSDQMLTSVTVTSGPADRVQVGPPTPLFPVARQTLVLNPAGQSAGYAVSADGERFYVPTPPDVGTAVVDLIVNWSALLPAR